jgi:hypothetical protein
LYGFRRTIDLLALLVALAGLPVQAGGAERVATERPAAPVYRLWVEADAEGRERIAAEGFDVAGHALALDRIELIVDEAERARLAELGFSFQLLEVRRGARPLAQGSQGQPSFAGALPDTRYHDPAEVEAYLQQVHADHPAITRLAALGSTTEGRVIWGLMISDNAQQDEDELAVLFNAAHHAREVMSTEVVLDTIEQLTDFYGSDLQLTDYVNRYQIWCVPMVNPDGVARVHEVDDYWRKNLRDNDGNGIIDGEDGVDLNRNYEWGWGGQCNGSSNQPWSQTYRGPAEGSEPETQALLDLGRRIRPVFDVEYHSYGEDVFYALSCDPALSPQLSTVPGADGSISRYIAEEYAFRIRQADGEQGFTAAPYGARVDGTGRDQQYHESGAIAFVTELNSAAEGGFHPDYLTWRDATVEGQRPGWRWLLERMGGPAVGGHVLDAESGLPLEAEIALDELSLPDGKRLASRPDSGRFQIIVPPGAYTLRVEAPGYQPTVLPVDVGRGPSASLEILLPPLGSRLLLHEPFEDPLRVADWTAGSSGDTATDGVWEWGEPQGTHSGNIDSLLVLCNPLLDRSAGTGTHAFVTGNQAAAAPDEDDVDGGQTSLISPAYDLSGHYGVRIHWQRWLRKEPLDPLDGFDLEVAHDGASWQLLDRLSLQTGTAVASPAWVPASALLDELLLPGPSVRLRFRVADVGADHLVEGALDELQIRGYSLEQDGRVEDLRLSGGAATLLQWAPVPGGPELRYDVVRGELAALAAGDGTVELGALDCLEQGSLDTSTAGDLDDELPPPGGGRFYLVRLRLGLSRGLWGAASDGAARLGSGGCGSP